LFNFFSLNIKVFLSRDLEVQQDLIDIVRKQRVAKVSSLYCYSPQQAFCAQLYYVNDDLGWDGETLKLIMQVISQGACTHIMVVRMSYVLLFLLSHNAIDHLVDKCIFFTRRLACLKHIDRNSDPIIVHPHALESIRFGNLICTEPHANTFDLSFWILLNCGMIRPKNPRPTIAP